MDHLRPHPTEVSAAKIKKLKNALSTSDSFLYVGNSRTYADFEIYNELGHPTIDHSGVGKAIRESAKPVVFFLTYDVGYNNKLKRFIRHIVCCVALHKKDILFFDMRDLCDISPKHQKLIEKELGRKSGIQTLKLVNASCFGECIYLQRFKGDYEMGWCIAWALFFLEKLSRMGTVTRAKVKSLYKKIDGTLEKEKSNRFIEEWFIKSVQSFL
jgi:hypothetical protein